MAFPTYSIIDLSEFSGAPLETYDPAYSQQALQQATILFRIGTCLSDFPTDSLKADIARMAILSMADSIVLAQGYREVTANPFSSETIGSYSYSKLSSAVSAGQTTGINWFDMAVGQLSECGLFNDGSTGHGGIEVFEVDSSFPRPHDSANDVYVPPYALDHTKYHDPSV